MLNNNNNEKYIMYPALFLVVSIAGFLRFYNIFDRGIWDFDGAVFADAAVSVYLTPGWIIENYKQYDSMELLFGNLADYIASCGGTSALSKHPLQILLNVGAFTLFGIEDYSIHILNSSLSILTVLLLFYFGRKFFSVRTAVVAACFLAVSGNHLFFSRVTGVQAGVVFFALLSSYLFLQSHKHPDLRCRLFFSGLVLGFALMIHKSVGLLWVTYLIIEWVYRNYHRNFFRRVFTLSLTSFLPFVIFEGALRVCSFLHSYFLHDELAERSGSNLFLTWGFLTKMITSELSGHVNVFVHSISLYMKEGGLCIFFFVIGLYLIVKSFKETRDDNESVFDKIKKSFILIGFLLPFVFWSLCSGKSGTTKGYQYCLPFLFLITAAGFNGINEKIFRKQNYQSIIVLVFVCLILFIGARRSWDLIFLKSGYKEAVARVIDYIKVNGGVVTSEREGCQPNPILAFYLGKEYQSADSELRESIILNSKKAHGKGDYVFLEWMSLQTPYRFSQELNAVKDCDPIFIVDNSMGKIPPLFWSNRNKMRLERIERIQKDPKIDKILVYDLRKCGKKN